MLSRVVNRCLGRDEDHAIHPGFHGHGELKCFLFRKRYGVIFKGKARLLKKKYSLLMHLYRRYINKSGTTYSYQWKNKDVYHGEGFTEATPLQKIKI